MTTDEEREHGVGIDGGPIKPDEGGPQIVEVEHPDPHIVAVDEPGPTRADDATGKPAMGSPAKDARAKSVSELAAEADPRAQAKPEAEEAEPEAESASGVGNLSQPIS